MGKTLTSAELIQILERVKDECGSEIDDTAGAGDTTKVWSADKTNSELNNLNSALNVLEDTENDYTVEGSFAYLMYETLGLYVDENGDICQREDA